MLWSTLTGKLERAAFLDPVSGAVTTVVSRVLPRGAVKDVLHGTWLGHQVHPILVALPIGMWGGATLLDLTGGPAGRPAAQRLVGAGALLVAPSAATGLADWSELGVFRRPQRVGLVHATSNALTTVVYAASWWARRQGDHERGRRLALVGALGLGVGGYLGGHMSYSQGVGVNRNADADVEPAEWTDAAAVSELVEGTARRVQVAGQPVMMLRRGGQVHAMLATCSHYGGPLEQGDVEVDGGEPCLVCPWHGSAFRLSDGSVARGPATAPQLSYDVRTTGSRVEVRVRS